jgi:hypothetical protein
VTTSGHIEGHGETIFRREPLDVRKATLRSRWSCLQARLRRHREQARKDSPYRSGRSPVWLKNEEPGCAGGEAGGGSVDESPFVENSLWRIAFDSKKRLGTDRGIASY